MTSFQHFRRLLLCLGLVLFVSSCGGDDKNNEGAMKMTWNFAAGPTHLGYVYAEKLGYYEELGIDIVFEEGRGSGTTAQLVATGRTDVGLANAATIISAITQGAPITIISPIIQSDMYSIISLAEAEIVEPTDLYGKRLVVCNGCAARPQFEAFAETQNLDLSRVEIVNVDGKAAPGLMETGQLDAMVGVPTLSAFLLEDSGHTVNVIRMSDYVGDNVTLSLVARRDAVSANPGLYRRFLSASLKGWEAVAKNPDEAAQALREAYPNAMPQERLVRSWKEYFGTLLCPKDVPFMGIAPQASWANTLALLATARRFPEDAKVADFYTDGLVVDPPACN